MTSLTPRNFLHCCNNPLLVSVGLVEYFRGHRLLSKTRFSLMRCTNLKVNERFPLEVTLYYPTDIETHLTPLKLNSVMSLNKLKQQTKSLIEVPYMLLNFKTAPQIEYSVSKIKCSCYEGLHAPDAWGLSCTRCMVTLMHLVHVEPFIMETLFLGFSSKKGPKSILV